MVIQMFTSVLLRIINGGAPAAMQHAWLRVRFPRLNPPFAYSALKPLHPVIAVVAIGAAKLPTTLNALAVILKCLYALIAGLLLPK
jgi:hypothetical protein